MQKQLLLIVILLACVPFYAQEQNIDSLKQVLLTSNDTSAKASAYKSILQNVTEDSLAFQKYLHEGIDFSRKISDKKTELELAFAYCQNLYDTGHYDKVIGKVDSLHSLFEKEGLIALKAKLYNIAGSAYCMKSDYANGSVQFLEYLETAKRLEDDPKSVALANNNIGMSLLNMKRYKQAIPYIENSLEFQQKYDSKVKARAHWNLGICHMELLEYDKALQIFIAGVEEANRVGDAYGAAGNQTCIASVLSRQRNFDEGIPAYIKAYEMSVDANLEDFKVIEALSGVIWGYNMSSQAEKAVKYIAIADSIIEANNMPDIRNREYLFFKSTNLMLRGKPMEADPYFLRYEKALDSMYDVKNIEIIQEKETEFRTKEKEQMVELQKAKLDFQNLLIILLGCGVVLLALIGFLIYRQQRLKIKHQEQEQALKEALHVLETTNKLEEQRLRISKELHDNIGSQLTYLASAAQNIGHGITLTTTEVTQEKLEKLSDFSQEAIRDLRDTIWVMNRSSISWDDLVERVRYLTHKVANTTGIDVVVTKTGADTVLLDPAQTMNIFRIIQEAINNAVKHAQASKIEVAIVADKQPVVKIIDNGIGYNPSEVFNNSNGLTNMKSRAQVLDADLEITSTNKGTEVSLKLPPLS
ncbi:tetratricopeptide repeat protein [Rasiella rasia]|uniref:Tetratricopeptide repeat protein n=1 Tax=Rasiella rasia TaxID=2744027 RepID=A0A6G6GQ14_9FLAO|nr:sensor histidine kinase [Rasiella rasia]QIE60523.1 tetratricopeptide repeat protein [Rasiella rasia]